MVGHDRHIYRVPIYYSIKLMKINGPAKILYFSNCIIKAHQVFFGECIHPDFQIQTK